MKGRTDGEQRGMCGFPLPEGRLVLDDGFSLLCSLSLYPSSVGDAEMTPLRDEGDAKTKNNPQDAAGRRSPDAGCVKLSHSRHLGGGCANGDDG